MNSDNACRYSSQTRWRVTLRLSEHRRELAREACLCDSYQTWNTVRYSTADTMQQTIKGHEIRARRRRRREGDGRPRTPPNLRTNAGIVATTYISPYEPDPHGLPRSSTTATPPETGSRAGGRASHAPARLAQTLNNPSPIQHAVAITPNIDRTRTLHEQIADGRGRRRRGPRNCRQ